MKIAWNEQPHEFDLCFALYQQAETASQSLRRKENVSDEKSNYMAIEKRDE